MNGLSAADCNILVEALDEWINKGQSGEIMGDLFEGLMTKEAPADVREQLAREKADRKAKAAYEKHQRQEIAALLKAKLIYLRRDIESREFAGIER